MCIKKKITLVLLCCVIMITTTGCGLGNKISDALTDITNKNTINSINGKCNSIRSIGCDGDTEAQLVLLEEAADKVANQGSGWKFWEWGKDNYCPPIHAFETKQNDKLIAKVNQQNRILDRALANDEAYQKNNKTKTSGILKKVGSVVAIIAAILLLILLLKKLRRKRVKTKSAPAQAPVGKAVHTGLLNDGGKAKRDVQELCAANGIDFDRVVAKFGDDDRGMTRAKMKIEGALKRGGIDEVNDLL